MKKILFCMTLMMTTSVFSKPLEPIATYGDWTAYVYQDATNKICYIAAEPEKSEGKYKKRDDVFLMVAHHPNEKKFDEVSVIAGYTYNRHSKPSLSVDKKRGIMMVSRDNTAWGNDNATDKRLIQQMKDGSKVVLVGTSARGTKTTDTFSLKGFSKAYNEISQACGNQ